MTEQQELLPNRERPYLSFSRLFAFGSCPRAYRARYVEHAAEIGQGALLGGSAEHDAIEAAEKEGLWASDDELAKAQEIFRQRFVELVNEAGGPTAVRWGGRKTREWPEGEDHRWWLIHGPQLMLPTYARIRRADDAAGVLKIEHAELQLLCELSGVTADDGGPVMVKGYLDVYLVVTADGEVVVRDWKTGASNAEPLQLASYAWQLAQTGRTQPLVGEFGYLRRGSVDKALKRHDLAQLLPLVPEQYRQFYGLLQLAHKADVFPYMPSSFCVACKVRMACPYGRTLGPPPTGWTTHPEEAKANG